MRPGRSEARFYLTLLPWLWLSARVGPGDWNAPTGPYPDSSLQRAQGAWPLHRRLVEAIPECSSEEAIGDPSQKNGPPQERQGRNDSQAEPLVRALCPWKRTKGSVCQQMGDSGW